MKTEPIFVILPIPVPQPDRGKNTGIVPPWLLQRAGDGLGDRFEGFGKSLAQDFGKSRASFGAVGFGDPVQVYFGGPCSIESDVRGGVRVSGFIVNTQSNV
jgi:hypothetical protein